MNVELKNTFSKLAAMALLVLCLLMLWAIIASPIVGVFSERNSAIAVLEQKLSRHEALISQSQDFESQLQVLQNEGGEQFYRSTSGSEALASMQSDVLRVVREVGLVVKSTQSRPETIGGEQTKIAFQINLTGESKNFARFLLNSERLSPLIYVNNIVIRAPRNQPTGRVASLDISMQVSSYFIEGGANVQ